MDVIECTICDGCSLELLGAMHEIQDRHNAAHEVERNLPELRTSTCNISCAASSAHQHYCTGGTTLTSTSQHPMAARRWPHSCSSRCSSR